VAEAAIARTAALDPRLGAVASTSYGRARDEALHWRDGAFAGVPTFVKDNTDVAGLPTRYGSEALEPGPAREDAPFVRQFLAQGFTLLGKSILPEFGLNASTEFAHRRPGRNPWNPEFSTGASSGGAAALVAAGAVPIAHANDGGGSIRIPAACCGLVGLKATRGRHLEKAVTRYAPVNLIGEGVLSRSVRDTAAFHRAAECYYRNPALPEIGTVEGPGKRRLRVGLWLETVTGDAIDRATRSTVESAARLLQSLGHSVEPIPAPITPQFAEDFGLYWCLLASLFTTTGKISLDPSFDPFRVDGLTRGLSERARRQFYRAPACIRALRKSRAQYQQQFETLDLVLSPTVAHTTPRLGHLSPRLEFEELFRRLMRYVGFTPWANAAGGPAIALPWSIGEHRLPTSIQLFAAHGGERTLLETAFEIEAEHPFPRIESCTA
jgi:amidase